MDPLPQRVLRRFLARLTGQAQRVEVLLADIRKPLSKAVHIAMWGKVDPTREQLAKDLQQASQQAIKELRFEFENPKKQEEAKHYLTRLKNLLKMVAEWAKVSTWAELEPVLKKQGTKSKTAYEKFLEYANEVQGLLSFLDTEHDGTINIGPWTVSLFSSHRADWDDEKMGKLHHILRETTKVLSAMGVGGAAGGRVNAYPTSTLTGATGSHSAFASYRIPVDLMSLAVDGDVKHVLHAVVHESGHRVYFKILSGNARSEWQSFFASESGPPDVDTIIKAWEAYANKPNDWEAQKYGRYTAYFYNELKKSDPDMSMWLSMITDKLPERDQLDKITGAPKKGTKTGLDILIENRSKIKVFLHPVTAYSGTSPEELFAEVFAAYALEGPGRVAEIVRDIFRRVLPQVHSAAAGQVFAKV
jgi:hypothetical protein